MRGEQFHVLVSVKTGDFESFDATRPSMPPLHFMQDIEAVALVGPHALARGVPHDTTPPCL